MNSSGRAWGGDRSELESRVLPGGLSVVYCRHGTETNEIEEGRNADIDGTVPRFHGSDLSSRLLV